VKNVVCCMECMCSVLVKLSLRACVLGERESYCPVSEVA